MPKSICLILLLLFVVSCKPRTEPAVVAEATTTTHPADDWLTKQPIPITAEVSPRSAGGPRDFYSEGDYWWPDPDNPDGPYVRRDGNSNPDNFVAHRHAMVDLSKAVSALVAAYQETGDRKYADHAMTYLRTWFVDPATSMTPHLLYAQAISGKVTGRGFGWSSVLDFSA